MTFDPLAPAITAENVERQRRIASRANQLYAPLFDDNLLAGVGEDSQIALDQACSAAWPKWKTERDELRIRVLKRFCELMPTIGMVKVDHDPADLDFHWSRVRCVLSAAGYAGHREVAEVCSDLYPQCSLDPDETEADWTAKLTEAHTKCGWPVTLALIPWRDLMGVYTTLERAEIEDAPGAQTWWRACALLHMLKHARDDGTRVVVTYRGTASFVKYEDSTNVIGQMRRLKPALCTVLSVPATDGRTNNVHPLAWAMNTVMNHVTVRHLLRREPLAALPGLVLHGIWSSVVPDPARTDGFVQHGLRLSGVWVASHGRVSATTGDDEDVVRFQWRLDTDTDAVSHARERFAAALPERFAVEFPSNLLTWAFPNVDLSMFTCADAALSIYDALICLSVIRQELRGADQEYPMWLVMPSDPTPDDSTNQGKSKAAHLLSQAMAPGIPLTLAADSEGAPDQRSLAGLISEFGSLCLDEWRQAKSRNAILSHDSLQSFITGGSRPVGRVYENVPVLIRLRQPIVASTKCASLPPDMVNRSVCLWLKTLSDEDRNRLDVVGEMDSGKLPLKMRLAAIALSQQYKLGDCVPRACGNFRFPVTFGLACRLFELRTGVDTPTAMKAVGLAAQEMQKHLGWHASQAEDSGLLAQQEDGESVRFRLVSLFDNLTCQEVAQWRSLCDMIGDSKRVTAGQLIKARGELVNLTGRPLSTIMSFVTGSRQMVSERAIGVAFNRDIKRLMPNKGDSWVLPDSPGLAGWRLVRGDDTTKGTARVFLDQVSP